MTTLLLRVLERIHGHLGWLSVAALLHPAILLRNTKRRARLSVSLATGFVVVTALLGAYIYPMYRDRIKQHLFIEVPKIGWMFERKEHLAVGAVAFALVGCVSHLTLPLVGDEQLERTMARLAHRAFVVAFTLALIVAVLGVTVASYKSF
jgi:energy-converting hydrogenase Eha subunit E